MIDQRHIGRLVRIKEGPDAGFVGHLHSNRKTAQYANVIGRKSCWTGWDNIELIREVVSYEVVEE